MLKVRPAPSIPYLVLAASAQALAAFLLAERLGSLAAAALLGLASLLILVLPSALPQARAELARVWQRLTWWHWLWLMLCGSGLVFRIREAQAAREAPVDFWAGYRVALVALVALVLAIRLALGRTAWLPSLFRGLVGAVAVYSLMCAVSTLWSVYPAWTLYKSAEFFVDVALLAAILMHTRSTEDFKGLFDWTWLLCVAAMVMIWVGALVWPAEAFLRGVGSLGVQLQGVFPLMSANGVGELAGILAVVALVRLQFIGRGGSPRALYFLLFLASVLTLALSQTRSAILGFLVGAALVLLLSKRIRTLVFFVWLLVMLLSVTTFGEVFRTYMQRGQSEEAFESLSGRVSWWTVGWQKFVERPLAGYGGYAGARFTALEEIGETSTSTIHNTYFEVLLGLGVPGLIPVLFALLGTWRILLPGVRNTPPRSLERQLAVEAVGVLAVLTLRTLFSSALVWHPELIFLQLLGYAEFLRRRKVSVRRSRRAVARRATAGLRAPSPSPRGLRLASGFPGQ